MSSPARALSAPPIPQPATVPAPAASGEAAQPGAPGWSRTVWVAAVSQLVAMIGFGMVMPFLPLYVQELGVTDRAEVALWAGLTFGAAALPMAIMAPVWGELADRFGRRLMLVRSMIGGAVLIGAMAFADNVWQFFVLRAVQGALTGSIPAAAAVIAAAAPATQMGMSLGLLHVMVNVGNVLGPGAGGELATAFGMRNSFLVCAAVLLVGGVLAQLWIAEPPRPRAMVHRGHGPAEHWLLRSVRPFAWPRFRTVLVLQLGVQFALTTSMALLPIYLLDLARPEWLPAERAAGLSFVLSAVSGAVVTPFMGRWTDRHGPRGLLLASLAGMVVAFVPTALVPDVGLFLALRLLVGVCMAGSVVALSVLTKLLAPAGREGVAYGANSTAQALGWGFGPMVGSAFAAVFGIPALFLASAAIACGLMVLVVRGPR